MKKVTKKSLLFFSVTAIFCLPLMFNFKKKIYVNFTQSMPRGLYLKLSDNKYKIGDIIVFYSEEKRCNLVKYVSGLPGDEFCISDGKILLINGFPQATLNIQKYGLSKHDQSFCQRLKNGEILALGEHPDSYDSRYFGPIKEEKVIARVSLIIQFK